MLGPALAEIRHKQLHDRDSAEWDLQWPFGNFIFIGSDPFELLM